MEEKYGKKYQTLKVQGMIYLPTVMVTILFAVVFFATLVSGLRSETGPLWPLVIGAGVCMVAAAVGLVRQVVTVNLVVYEKDLVQHNMFGTRVINSDELRAILWQFPGANPINSRAARINNTSAELIFKDGSKSLKIQDSYYQDLETAISAYQRRNNVPADLETKKKGGSRYD